MGHVWATSYPPGRWDDNISCRGKSRTRCDDIAEEAAEETLTLADWADLGSELQISARSWTCSIKQRNETHYSMIYILSCLLSLNLSVQYFI